MMRFLLAFLLPLMTWAPAVSALTPAEQNAMLDCNNNFRSSMAKGTAANRTGLLPAGSNIFQLRYNASIETIAQNWANGCSMTHSSNSQRPGLGENLFMTSSSTITKTAALQQACQLWWQEVVQFGIQASLQLTVAEFNKGIGHWTQMAWANTVQIGCGVGSCPSNQWKTFVVCNYGPAGNFLNRNIYQRGTPCSGCSRCNSTAGLCVV